MRHTQRREPVAIDQAELQAALNRYDPHSPVPRNNAYHYFVRRTLAKLEHEVTMQGASLKIPANRMQFHQRRSKKKPSINLVYTDTYAGEETSADVLAGSSLAEMLDRSAAVESHKQAIRGFDKRQHSPGTTADGESSA